MKKLPNKSLKTKSQSNKVTKSETLNLSFLTFDLNSHGFAPIIAVIASGFFLAIAIFMVSTRTFTFNSPLTPNPSPASFDEIEISAPVPVDPSDEACDDEFNFDCDDLEGDDVDPADLAGPD